MKIETKYDVGQKVFLIWYDEMRKAEIKEIRILYVGSSFIEITYLFEIEKHYIERSEESISLTKEGLCEYLKYKAK